MIIICAWCKKTVGNKEPLDDKSVTHGIFRKCLERELQKFTPEEQVKESS